MFYNGALIIHYPHEKRDPTDLPGAPIAWSPHRLRVPGHWLFAQMAPLLVIRLEFSNPKTTEPRNFPEQKTKTAQLPLQVADHPRWLPGH